MAFNPQKIKLRYSYISILPILPFYHQVAYRVLVNNVEIGDILYDETECKQIVTWLNTINYKEFSENSIFRNDKK